MSHSKINLTDSASRLMGSGSRVQNLGNQHHAEQIACFGTQAVLDKPCSHLLATVQKQCAHLGTDPVHAA